MLTIHWQGQVYRHSPDERVVLGRGELATYRLDAAEPDEYLSREAVVLERDDSFWTIVNGQSEGRLTVVLEGGTTAALDPGAAPFVVPHGSRGTLVLQTLRRYHVEFEVSPSPVPRRSVEPGATVGPDTDDITDALGLTAAELRLLACLAEPRLLRPGDLDAGLPSHAEVEARLGLSAKQLERLLDSIVAKLSPHVAGLHGDNTRRATDRRRRVVDFAIESGAITTQNLNRLAPRREK